MYVPFNKVKWDNNNQFGIHRNKIGITFPALILTITCGTKEISFRFFFFSSVLSKLNSKETSLTTVRCVTVSRRLEQKC